MDQYPAAACTSSQSGSAGGPSANTALIRLKLARSTTPACPPPRAHASSYSSTMSRRMRLTTNSCPPPSTGAPGAKATRASSIRNGAVLRARQRTSWSNSAGRAGTFSNRSSDTLAALSGTTRATRRGAPGNAWRTSRTTSRTASGSTMLAAFAAGVTTPAGSGRETAAATRRPRSRTTPVTRSAAISIPAEGAGAANSRDRGASALI